MDKSVKFRVGVIGVGRVSCMHLSSIDILPETQLVCVCDNKKEVADEVAKKYGVKSYYDYKEMLDTEKLDAVHLCLPHYLHSKVACYAFSKGVNVLTEKPMDVDYESAVNAVETAKKYGVQFGVIFQCRYNNAPQCVKKALLSGKLGKIITARSILTWSRSDDYYSHSDWKGTWDKEGGGVVIDQAIHSIDLVNFMVDSDIKTVSCHMANRGHQKVVVEDTAEGLITYENGVKYAFYCMNNYGCDEPIEIRLYCESGKAVFGYDDAYITYNDGTTEEAHQDYTEDYGGGKDYWGNKHIKQIKQFYNALAGKEELEMSGQVALKTHKLIMDIYKIGKESIK